MTEIHYICRMKKISGIFMFFFVFPALLYSQEKYTREAYIEKYWRVAVEEMHKSGIPASITLAQACLESDNGNSYLAVKGNNHFGIKCHGWEGKSIRRDDDRRNECFRSYGNAIESFRDHSDFLVTRSRYSKLFDLEPTDYEGWAYGLSEAGYATDPSYPQSLIRIIETHNLMKYDRVGAAETVPYAVPYAEGLEEGFYGFRLTRELEDVNGLAYIVTSGEESIRSIAKEFNLTNRELKRYNDLKTGSRKLLDEGMKIYLVSKKRKAPKGTASSHVVEGRETLWDISQKYGIKLKSLCRMNGLEADGKVAPGDEIKLR